MDYITCEKRKNSPKINVLICEKKCGHAKICKPYLNYLKAQSSNAAISECAHTGEDLISIKSSNSKKSSLIAIGKQGD
jgi:hypothetical protein